MRGQHAIHSDGLAPKQTGVKRPMAKTQFNLFKIGFELNVDVNFTSETGKSNNLITHLSNCHYGRERNQFLS